MTLIYLMTHSSLQRKYKVSKSIYYFLIFEVIIKTQFQHGSNKCIPSAFKKRYDYWETMIKYIYISYT